MVSALEFQERQRIIRRKIALLDENNKMTDKMLDALSKKQMDLSYEQWLILEPIWQALSRDGFVVGRMIQDLERQLIKCW